MATKKYLLGIFDDEITLMKAVKGVRAAGTKIYDVYTPFPVHGLDDAMGLRHTRLHTAGFLFGATGVLLMFLYITWINTVNYPIIVGGKPYFALPAYIPVLFEITVLSAAVGMVIAYFVRNGLSPIRQEPPLDPRATDHKFVVAFDAEELSGEMDNVKELLAEHGASEINEKEID